VLFREDGSWTVSPSTVLVLKNTREWWLNNAMHPLSTSGGYVIAVRETWSRLNRVVPREYPVPGYATGIARDGFLFFRERCF
jgi:hypothetical protein